MELGEGPAEGVAVLAARPPDDLVDGARAARPARVSEAVHVSALGAA